MSKESEKFIREFVSTRVRQLLVENNIKNKKSLSQLIGHGEKCVANLSSNKTNPTVSVVYDFCEYFGITLDDFFHEDYSKDKSAGALMKLLDEKLEGEDRTLLYKLIDHLDKNSIRTILKAFETYNEAETKNESN
ncbi:helix-turn-helix domain-containing protein [Christensenella hongkongensis]|uniref:helix-turn-helix domain-containing protein n=1 Tax=Christensenella hongkongensis TaxID=270498 RepID=UPI0026711D11|nr:helix-turn-helix transcriptional regulator [Christensenella hongkongensis]